MYTHFLKWSQNLKSSDAVNNLITIIIQWPLHDNTQHKITWIETPKLLPSSILGMSNWTHILTCKGKRGNAKMVDWKIAEIVCMCVWAGLDCFLFKCSSIKRRTVLHFSIRVRISGFTLSIRSTSWALHFNIPPGTARILEPTKVMSKQDYECQGLLHQVFNHSYVMSFQSSVCDRNV